MADAGGDSLATSYDLVMFDLDGVVYVDGHAVKHAARSIAETRSAGAHIAFITNNASRTPQQVADHLRELGVRAEAEDVVTSSQAAARLLRETHGEGAAIAVLGAEGLVAALREAGLEPVGVGDDRAVAIVSGYAPEVRWREIMQAAVEIRSGLPWTATNTDPTLPTDRGLAPGHGLLVRMISEFAEVAPVVAGKPQRPLLDETLRRVGGSHPLMVGDRLDTDIAGAHNAGTDSLLVMTGVSRLSDLVAARPEERPTWIGHDLSALGRPGCAVTSADGRWEADGWSARLEHGRVVVDGSGSPDAWWAVAAGAAWAHRDRTGDPADVSDLAPPVRDESAG
ncbi:MAG: HAD-IIA family hydrolase [Nocardioides sp.]